MISAVPILLRLKYRKQEPLIRISCIRIKPLIRIHIFGPPLFWCLAIRINWWPPPFNSQNRRSKETRRSSFTLHLQRSLQYTLYEVSETQHYRELIVCKRIGTVAITFMSDHSLLNWPPIVCIRISLKCSEIHSYDTCLHNARNMTHLIKIEVSLKPIEVFLR